MFMGTTHFASDCFRDGHFLTRCIPLVILLLALCTGCSNTELEGSWTSPKFNGPKLTSFAVLGVTRETTLRRVAEDAFVNELAVRGLRAVPSYQFLPADPEPLAREQVEQAVKQQPVQGAIVAWVVKVEKQTRGGSGYSGAGQGFAARYQEGWSRSYVGTGSDYEYNVVTVDVQLYDVKTGELVWSGVTRTFDTSNLDSSTAYWAKVIVQELAKRGVI
jgi:hypothetical protein